ncbi:MAG TPA: hypothetical protein VIX18_06480 [Nitrospirota bacterium]
MIMKFFPALSVMLAVVSLTGCTSRGIYEGLRMQQEMECRSHPGASPEECSGMSGMSYDEYQRRLEQERKDK